MVSQNAHWEASAQSWIDFVATDVNRTQLLDVPMLRLCAPYAGQRVLDVGCGEGRWCRRLSESGAVTTGLDPIPALLDEARARHSEGVYVQGIAEQLPFPDASFDLVVSYITLVDIPDAVTALAEMGRVLAPGGRLVIANLNSWCTTRPVAWYADPATGQRLHIAVEDYYERRAIRASWRGITILMYHRPFEEIMQALLAQGLRLTAFEEPRPTPEQVAEFPSMGDEYKVPLFHVMAWSRT